MPPGCVALRHAVLLSRSLDYLLIAPWYIFAVSSNPVTVIPRSRSQSVF